MFARRSDASKTAFVHAAAHLQRCGIALIDCQQNTDHMARFGSRLLPFDDFQAALDSLCAQELWQDIGSGTLAQNRLA